MWYTDNGGQSYSTAKQKMPKMDEAQLVQNDDGLVLANMRWRGSPTQGRGIATSTDGGSTFSNVSFDAALKTTVCQASIFRSPQNGWIYYSAPGQTARQHGTIRRSKTGLPNSWQPTALEVTNASAVFAYSALCDHPQKGMGGLLWESKGGIVFSAFPLEF